MELISRFLRPSDTSFFVFGPRGTGKSTWLREVYPDAVYIDLLDQGAFRTYLARPERLEEVVGGNPKAKTFIVDEIQKAPALLDQIHRLIEANRQRQLQFVLTGSSARKLKRAGTDLLAGRAVLKTLHPFMAAELGTSFDFMQSLRLGMIPLVLGSMNPEETLGAYVSLYLREEVQAESMVRNVGNFARFLEALSFSHASLLNTAQVARDCQVNRKTVDGFIEVLEDLLLGFRLQVFSKRAQRLLVQHPKFYYVDPGVFRSIRPKGPLDSPEEIGGACLEGLVAQHLRAWIAYSNGGHTLHFWRTKAGLEVDFIIYGQETLVALEVKRSATVTGKDLRSLAEFIQDYPQAKACLLYGGRERLRINNITCLPCDEFLRNLRPNDLMTLLS